MGGHDEMNYSVGQVLDRIGNGDKMNEIVSEFGLLKKHFSEQLKDLGYRGDRAGRYHWDHEEPEPLDFDLLDKYRERVDKHLQEQPAATLEEVNNSNASNSKAIATPLIQFVQEKQEEPKKIYRGYYFSPEVIRVMDQIHNKSEVADLAFKEFFQKQGLL